MKRGWGLLFLFTPLFVVAFFAVSPAFGWTWPENISVLGGEVDALYSVTLFLCGAAFLGTQLFLAFCLFKFRDTPGRDAVFIRGSGMAEALWTGIPTAIIVALAVKQLPTWNKMIAPRPAGAPYLAEVLGRRFEWRITYAGPDGKLGTPDDFVLANELHLPPREEIWLRLAAEDVVHSAFLPEFRFKQDCVPGMRIDAHLEAIASTADLRKQYVRLEPADFLDLDGLLKDVLRTPKTPLAKFLAANAAKNAKNTSPQALIGDLNAAIAAQDWAAEPAFKDVPRTRGAAEAQRLGPDFRPLANRELLAAAFPQHVKPLRRDYQLVCAELCGEGHGQMRGVVVVHPTRIDFDAWLRAAHAAQEVSR